MTVKRAVMSARYADQCDRISAFPAIAPPRHDAANRRHQDIAMTIRSAATDPIAAAPTRAAIRARLRALARASRLRGAPIFARTVAA